MKKTWETLNNLLGRNKPTKATSYFTDDDGAEIKDPKMIANRFNDFFTNIDPSLASKIPPPNTTVLEHILSYLIRYFLLRVPVRRFLKLRHH